MPVPVPPPPPAPYRREPRRPVLAGVTVTLLIACVIGLALATARHPASQAGTGSSAPPAATTHRSPTPRPKPTPALSCKVDYQVTDYTIGFSAQLTVTNTGTSDIRGWKLAFDLPANQDFKWGLGGSWSRDGQRLTAKDLVLNAQIKPGGTVGLSLVGTSKGKVESPKSFTLNDVACRGGDG